MGGGGAVFVSPKELEADFCWFLEGVGGVHAPLCMCVCVHAKQAPHFTALSPMSPAFMCPFPASHPLNPVLTAKTHQR